MAALRELVVKLSANTVEFSKDIGLAIRDVGRFSNEFTRSMRSANAALTGFVASAAGAITLDWLVGEIDKTSSAMAKLVDMSQKTGSAIVTLSQLQKLATAFGGDSDAINQALNNLARGMSGADEESSKLRNALQQMGISSRDLAQQDPSQVFIRIAQSLQGYRDGAGKAALVTDLFKRNAADLLPFLNDVAEHLDDFGGVSEDTAQRAKAFEDSMGVLHVRAGELRESLVSSLLPAMSDFTSALAKLISDEAKLDEHGGLAAWAEAAVTAITAVMNALAALSRLVQFVSNTIAAGSAIVDADNAQQRDAIREMYREDKRRLLEEPLFGNRLRDQMARQRAQRQSGTEGSVHASGHDGAHGSANDPRGELNYQSVEAQREAEEAAKRRTDNAMREWQRQITLEAALLASRNRMLDAYNAANLISIGDYYTARRSAQEQNLQQSLALNAREIAAQQAFLKTATTDANRAQAQDKLRELQDQRSELQRQATEAIAQDLLKEQKAYADLTNEVRNLNAQLLELQGRAGDAAKLRFTGQYRDIRQRLSAEGDTASLKMVDQLERAQVAQAEFNQLAEQGARVQERLRLAEELAAVSQYSGAASELQTMSAVSAARQQAVREQEQIVKGLEQVAAASQNPALLVQAEAARSALEKLRAESDLLGKKFQTIFVDNMSNALADFVTGAKSAKEAFKAFADGVVQQITRMAAEAVSMQLYQALMGGGEGGGGIIPGKVAQSGGGGGILGALVKLGVSYFTGGGQGMNPFGGQLAATDAMFPAGAPIRPGDLGDFPGLAGGGPVSANSPYYVGEFGKEVFVPNVDGRILPRTEFSQGQTNVINITQNIPKDMSRASAQQLAADTGMQVNRAVRRNT